MMVRYQTCYIKTKKYIKNMGKIKKKPWLAGLLSFLVTGMGQVYNKKYKEGILLFFLGIFTLVASYTFAWIGMLYFVIWIYSIYDAYTTAKRTIKEEPYKNAIWITAIIFIIIFVIGVIAGILAYWASSYSVEETNQTLLKERIETYEKTRERVIKEDEELLNKLNEASISFKANDTVTARNKISEAKSILIDLKNDYEFICSFQENNRDLFPNITDSDIKTCKAWLEIYRTCFPKYLDSYYSLTYLLEKANQIKTQEDTESYKESCYSWLNEYNVIRGSCNTIIELNKLDIKPFEDYSSMCEISVK